MSLDVNPELVDAAEHGRLDEADFLECVRRSLPYAWSLISGLVVQLHVEGGEYVANEIPPPDEQTRGQILRALASDAVRGALERHFEVKLAFQNCHRVAAFPPAGAGGPAYQRFVSLPAQVLNQTPELRDC